MSGFRDVEQVGDVGGDTEVALCLSLPVMNIITGLAPPETIFRNSIGLGGGRLLGGEVWRPTAGADGE